MCHLQKQISLWWSMKGSACIIWKLLTKTVVLDSSDHFDSHRKNIKLTLEEGGSLLVLAVVVHRVENGGINYKHDGVSDAHT